MSEVTENHKITDLAAGITKAIIASNPITGFVQSIYDEYASRQWQQRREFWEEKFEERLSDIQDKVDFNSINSIPNFAQILSNSVQGAMGDIEEDKVELYVNVVINAIKKESIDNTKTHIFLNMLREFTSLHIQILKFIQQYIPDNNFSLNQFAITDTKSILFNQLKQKFKNNSFLKHCIKDLHDNNLINCEHFVEMHMRGNVNSEEYYPQSATELGKEFLDFISNQEKTND